MHPDQYTPDNVCRAMGLTGFAEPGWPTPTLRVLLTPSFDPEVCVTLAPGVDTVQVAVVALRGSLWQQPGPRPMPAWSERARADAADLARLLAGFAEALAADRDPAGRMVCICDGMGVNCVAVTNASSDGFACNPYRPAVRTFVADVIRLAWSVCTDAGVRNALAACGRYVGIALPLDPVPPPGPTPTRLMILGEPADRAELAAALRWGRG